MGLAALIAGLIAFIAPHVLVTRRAARARLIARLGEGPYKIAFSLLSAIGIALMVWGFARYRAGEWIELWHPPVWARHLSLVLAWPAMILIAAAYLRGNIYRLLKHPMLAGVKLWALAHLIANGDLGSLILFGSLLAWAVYDRISLKSRSDPGAPPIPTGGWPRDAAAVVVGTLLYLVVVYWFHPAVIGTPVL